MDDSQWERKENSEIYSHKRQGCRKGETMCPEKGDGALGSSVAPIQTGMIIRLKFWSDKNSLAA